MRRKSCRFSASQNSELRFTPSAETLASGVSKNRRGPGEPCGCCVEGRGVRQSGVMRCGLPAPAACSQPCRCWAPTSPVETCLESDSPGTGNRWDSQQGKVLLEVVLKTTVEELNPKYKQDPWGHLNALTRQWCPRSPWPQFKAKKGHQKSFCK